MKIYKDKDLQEELEEIIDLGIVDAGDVKTFNFWLLNDTPYELVRFTYELKKIDRETDKVTQEISEEAKVIRAPEGFLPNTSNSIIIEYAPLVTMERGLKVSLQIRGKKLRD